MDSELAKLHAKLFGKRIITKEEKTYVCEGCGTEKRRFGKYCNLTCYFKDNPIP